MAILKIITYGNPILQKKAEPVEDISNNEIQTLIKDMINTLYVVEGLGLAAPQVGISKRVIIIDLSKGEEKEFFAIINPVITEKEGFLLEEEGCLSFPGIRGEVKRFKRVVVKGFDKDGKEIEIKGENLIARILQHEIDHLDGILFIDRMKIIKRQLLTSQLKELKKKTLKNL